MKGDDGGREHHDGDEPQPYHHQPAGTHKRILRWCALREGLRVHVLTRGDASRRLAESLGVDSVGPATGRPPELLNGAILFAPAGELVPIALSTLDRGATLAVAGIWLSTIPPLDYDAELFQERKLRSVTANTRTDGQQFLTLAARHRLRATTVPYSWDQADQALSDLAAGHYSGAAVLHMAATSAT
jgi:alcohol dehydrogenase, propanol-preferring